MFLFLFMVSCREPINNLDNGAKKAYRQWKLNPPAWYRRQRGAGGTPRVR